MKNNTINILIADDHQLFSDGLAKLLTEGDRYSVIGNVTNGKQLMQFLNRLTPDLILLDINMPYMDGLQAVTEIRKKLPVMKIIFISMYHDAKIITFCKQNDINGYLPKDITAEVLKQSIDSVIEGSVIYLFERNAEKQSSQSVNNDFIQKFRLSPKEIEIIQLIKQGLTSRQIAHHLFLSELTIETHRKNIFRKLDVKSVGGLVQFANQNGI